MSESNDHIHIHLDIKIPVGIVGGPVVVQTSQDRLRKSAVQTPYVASVLSVVPANNDVHFVRPIPNMALGTICATVTLDEPACDVKAKVYPNVSSMVENTPPSSAIGGRRVESGLVWKWEDASGNALPDANHGNNANSYPENLLAIWWTDTATGNYLMPNVTRFKGRTGTDVPCGGSGGGSGGSGSGGGMLKAATFPAYWAAEVKGLTDSAAVFNSLYLLQSQRVDDSMFWHNQGDGVNAVRATLKYCNRAGNWEFTVTLGNQQVKTVSQSANQWGPIIFPVGGINNAAGASIRVMTF